MTPSSAPEYAPLHRALHVACAFLENHHLDYALIGGIAVAVWGEPRATFDVDLVVTAGAEQVEHLRSAIRQEPAFLLEPETLSFPPHTLVLRAHLLGPPVEEPDLILVDFLFLEAGFSRAILGRRLSVAVAGRQVWICSPEDLILLKLLAGRVKDLEDARGVLAGQRRRIDLAYLEDRVQHLGCRENWARLTG